MDESQKDKPLKRGRGSQKKIKVLAESIPVETPLKKDDKPRKVNHIKMLVIEDLKASTIDKQVVEHIDKNAIIDSDNSMSYTNFSSLVQEHRPKVIPKNEIGKALPRVHVAISNAKRMLLDIFQDINPSFCRII